MILHKLHNPITGKLLEVKIDSDARPQSKEELEKAITVTEVSAEPAKGTLQTVKGNKQ